MSASELHTPHFIDECTVVVRAGDGGNGCASFRREPNNPRGGPSGGDGGDGGSVILVGDGQLGTLQDVHYQREYRAPRGEHGQGRDRYGRAGDDVIVPVPLGTVVYEHRDSDGHGELLCDLREAGQRFIAARGGRGGRGNIHFATATNQAPHNAEPGEPGQERRLRLELKLLADVGLLGYPNVGKSTLIARVSRARPKIADYPFTTLTPHLGVVGLPFGSRAGRRQHAEPDRTFVLADIPGLIEGAHRGHGLGLKFLRHLTRTRLLLHLVCLTPDPDRDPLRDYDVLNEELRSFDAELAARPQLVALSKLDLTESRERLAELRAGFAARGIKLHAISAATGEGIGPLLEEIYTLVTAAAQGASRSVPA